MNNTLERVYEDLIRLLQDDIIPNLDGDAPRAQVFGVIFMLKNLQRRTDWAAEPLVGQIRAQDALFARLRELIPATPGHLPAQPRLPMNVLDGRQLLALRDAGNASISDLIGQAGIDSSSPAMNYLMDYARTELDMEMRYTPKPMFGEMSSGKSAGKE